MNGYYFPEQIKNTLKVTNALVGVDKDCLVKLPRGGVKQTQNFYPQKDKSGQLKPPDTAFLTARFYAYKIHNGQIILSAESLKWAKQSLN